MGADEVLADTVVGKFVLRGDWFFKHPTTGEKYYDVTPEQMGYLFAALQKQGVSYSGKSADEVEIDARPHIYSQINAGKYGVIKLHIKVDHQIG